MSASTQAQIEAANARPMLLPEPQHHQDLLLSLQRAVRPRQRAASHPGLDLAGARSGRWSPRIPEDPSYALQKNLEFAGRCFGGVGNRLGNTTTSLGGSGIKLVADWAAGNAERQQTLQGTIVGAGAAIQAMSGWRNMGLQLGYGTPGSTGNTVSRLQ